LTNNAPLQIPYRQEELETPEGQIQIVQMTRSQINLLSYLNRHCRFFTVTGDTITGVMLPDNSEEYFIIKTHNLKEYKLASDSKDINRMKELRLYIDKADIINAEFLEY